MLCINHIDKEARHTCNIEEYPQCTGILGQLQTLPEILTRYSVDISQLDRSGVTKRKTNQDKKGKIQYLFRAKRPQDVCPCEWRRLGHVRWYRHDELIMHRLAQRQRHLVWRVQFLWLDRCPYGIILQGVCSVSPSFLRSTNPWYIPSLCVK